MELLTYHLQVAVIQLLAYFAYRVLLADLPLGQLKRLYLLAALGLSFLVPGWLILDSAAVPTEWRGGVVAGTAFLTEIPMPANEQSGTGAAWWLFVYWCGVCLTGAVFFKSIYRLIQQRRRATYIRTQNGVQLYSLPTAVAPHTFGRWVFYPLDRPLSPVVLAHEWAHARQWHTVDRLLIGALRVVCWFNPVLWLYERAIRQNHELLADRAALRTSGASVVQYQHEILHWLSPRPDALPLSSALSYAFTKKRLFMLARTTPTTTTLLGRLCLLGVVWAALFFGFAERGIAQTAADHTPATSVVGTPPAPEMTYGEFRAQQYQQQKAKNPQLPPPPPVAAAVAALPLSEFRAQQLAKFNAEPANPPTAAQLEAFRDATRYRVWIDGLEVPNSRVADYVPTDFFRYTSAQPRHNPRNLTSIGLITHTRRARTAARLAREAETFVRIAPPVVEPIEN